MMRFTYKYILAALLIIVFSVTGCTHNHSEHADEHDHSDEHLDEHVDEDHEMETANGVVFTKEMMQAVDFSVVPVSKMQIGNVIESVAQILPAQGSETVISAKTDGIVKLSAKSLAIGSSLSSGSQICSINASATATNNLSVAQQQAETEYERAKAEYERLKSLRDNKLALESEVANAKAAMLSAESQLKVLRSGFSGGVQSVTSPISGYLKQLFAKDGQFVQAGAQIAIVTQSQNLQLNAEVPVSYYNSLKNISDANILVPEGVNGEKKCYTLSEIGGRVVSYAHQVTTDSPLLSVTFEVKNVLSLVPGTFVDIFIKTTSSTETLCVPADAIIEEMGNWFVFVQVGPELFEKRQVTIGETDGRYTSVLSGLKESEKIVHHGVILIRLQQAAGQVDPHAGHNH